MGSKTTSKDDVHQAIEAAKSLAHEFVKSGSATQADRNELATAAMGMTTTCQTPMDLAFQIMMEGLCSCALRVAIEAGWTDVLKVKESVTADELVEKCGGEKNTVVRFMRVLTANNIAREVGFQTYAATDVMLVFLQPGIIDLFKHLTDSVNPVLTTLPLYLSNTTFAEPASEATGPYAFTFSKPHWKRLASDPALGAEFDRAMTVSNDLRGSPAECFPFALKAAELNLAPSDVFLVDIGGGLGHQTSLIKQLHPNISGRLIVQDLPNVVEHAKRNPIEGVEFQAHDMFTPQPVDGAAFYFLSGVLHDWADGPCMVVLKHVRKAMRKGFSRLLLAEWVLPDVGAGKVDAGMDLWMLATVCGKERTKSQWDHLLSQAGFKIKEIHRKGVASVLEIEIE